MRLRDDSGGTIKRIAKAGARETTVQKARRIEAPPAVTARNPSVLVHRPQAFALPGRQAAKMLPLSEDTNAAIFRFHASDAEQVIRVMIATACADGVVDEHERRRICDYLADAGSTSDELAYAEDQLREPSTL